MVSTFNSVNAAYVVPPGGLTGDEAHQRYEKFGPNTLPDTSVHPFRRALEKRWAPVPWMLEAAIALELVPGKYVEAAIIAFIVERGKRLEIPMSPEVLAAAKRVSDVEQQTLL